MAEITQHRANTAIYGKAGVGEGGGKVVVAIGFLAPLKVSPF